MVHVIVIGYFLTGAAGFALIIILFISSVRWKNRIVFYLFLFVLSLVLIAEANCINFF